MEDVKQKRLLRLSKSCVGQEECDAVINVLKNQFLGMGAEVQEFEKQLTSFFGRPTICVSNGTAALQLAIQGCGIKDGDEVLVQSLTYVASFQAISATGAIPVACDVDQNTLTIDLKDAEKRITSKTKAIMPVHYSGGVGQLESIYEFAQKKGLRVIEDAAHAFGSKYQGNRIGSTGDISCFSFDGIKNITSGEGGCVVTNDHYVAQFVRDARLLGVEKDTEMRYAGERSWNFDVHSQGWRYHMSNVMAAIGIEQLKRFEALAHRRRNLANRYDMLFKDCKNIRTIKHDYQDVVPHIYVVELKDLDDRLLLQKKLLEKGIQTGVHYQPNHWLSYYRKSDKLPLEVTDSIYPRLLSLPLHPDLMEDDVEFVAYSLKQLLNA